MSDTPSQKIGPVPGVHVTEIPAFPNPVVGLPTAIPVFVGHTEFALDPATGMPVYLAAVPIASMAEFRTRFGGNFDVQCSVVPAGGIALNPKPDFRAPAWNASDSGADADPVLQAFTLQAGPQGGPVTTPFPLYLSMMLFFANGGGECFVVSVGDYWDTGATAPKPFPEPADLAAARVSAQKLIDGLDVAAATRGPTMIVVPELCQLTAADYVAVVQAMLEQAGRLRDRMAILDLPGALDAVSWESTDNAAFTEQVDAMATAVSGRQQYASYGAAYGPAVEASVLGPNDVTYRNLCGSPASMDQLNNLLSIQAATLYAHQDVALPKIRALIGQAFPPSSTCPFQPLSQATAAGPADAAAARGLHDSLVSALPLLGEILQVLLAKLNAAPASGAIAGIWTSNDQSRGVWNAPANCTLAAVTGLKVAINDDQQRLYNVPLDGHSVAILRDFPNRGAVVWGARTLDGNSMDFRYIQVRRTVIYCEQSIEQALQAYVFEPNEASTWTAVTSMIGNFLTSLWRAGGLMGAQPTEAFEVRCGLGSTMTAQDIQDGRLIVNVALAIIRPAEFIELSFTEIMQRV